MAERGGAPAAHRDARGTTQRTQRNHTALPTAIGIVVVESGMTDAELYGVPRGSEARYVDLHDIQAIAKWEPLDGADVAFVRKHASPAERNEIVMALCRIGASRITTHCVGGSA